MPTRIVHILHHSPSFLHPAPLAELLERSGWHLEVARFQRRFLADVEIECWTPERRAPSVLETQRFGVKSLFFPSHGLGYQKEVSFAILRRLRQRAKAIDWVFLHGSVSYLSSILLASFGDDLKIVVQNHGERSTLTRCAEPRASKPLDYRLRVHLERRAFSKAHKILCLNPDNVADYRRNGVPEQKLASVTMGVDLEIFKPLPADRQALRRELGLPTQGVCLGFVGRLAGEKQVDKLVAAMRELPAEHTLVIVGDGPLRAELTERAREQGGAIVFLGGVSDRANLNRLYNAFDLLVLPSAQEGFPMVLLESMAAGTPVLASDLAGPRVLLENETHGSLSRAKNPPELAREIRAALARSFPAERLVKRASDYSWRAICEKYAEILGISASPA